MLWACLAYCTVVRAAVQLRGSEAAEVRNGLARSVYAALFAWLVQRVNASLGVGSARERRCHDDNALTSAMRSHTATLIGARGQPQPRGPL